MGDKGPFARAHGHELVEGGGVRGVPRQNGDFILTMGKSSLPDRRKK